MLIVARKHGLDDCPTDVVNMVSHATAERLKNLLQRLSVVTEHRLEIYKVRDYFIDHHNFFYWRDKTRFGVVDGQSLRDHE